MFIEADYQEFKQWRSKDFWKRYIQDEAYIRDGWTFWCDEDVAKSLKAFEEQELIIILKNTTEAVVEFKLTEIVVARLIFEYEL